VEAVGLVAVRFAEVQEDEVEAAGREELVTTIPRDTAIVVTVLTAPLIAVVSPATVAYLLDSEFRFSRSVHTYIFESK